MIDIKSVSFNKNPCSTGESILLSVGLNYTEDVYDVPTYNKIMAVENEFNPFIGGRNLLIKGNGPFELYPRNTGTAGDNYNFKTFNYDLKAGETYSFSADVEITAGTFNTVTVFPYTTATDSANGDSTKNVALLNNLTRVECTFTAVANNANLLLYAGKSGSTRGNGMIIRNAKLERGNTVTAWTPAPEDLV